MPSAKERLQHLVISRVDALYQRLHAKGYLPPWVLRFTVGSPADFEVTGAEFLAYLKLLCGLKSHHHILDIGCGCGMMALQLKGFLSGEGRYAGMDIDPNAVAWCQAHIATQYPRFAFYHANLRNPRYNPQGTSTAAGYRFPEHDASFDVILLKSVFTHMQPDDVQNYLDEIARLLKARGCCLATFFLFDDEQSIFTRWENSLFTFDYGDRDCRYASQSLPEKAIAYREGFLRDMLKRSHLVLAAGPYYGTWSGRPDGLSLQDVLLIARE